MNISTLGDAKASDICEVLNISPNDPRFLQRLNEAQMRLLNKGKWVNTIEKYSVCLSNGEITWPRRFGTIEAAAVCRRPITIRNKWFEYLATGPGELRECDGCHTELADRPMACTMADIEGENKKLKIVCDVSQDVGKMILVRGIDATTGEQVMTEVDGEWILGEFITMSQAGILSTKTYAAGALTNVLKPITQAPVRVYEYDTVEIAQRVIAIYEPDETRPWYRRSMIPGLSRTSTCACEPCTSSGGGGGGSVGQQIFSGDGPPSSPPTDPTKPAAYYDRTNRIIYWWNTVSQAYE